MAQVDFFLKIGDIKGESTDDKHKDEIELESFSWGLTQAGTSGRGAGAGAGKALPQDFHFVKKMDKSSPVLFMGCATGQHHAKAVLTVRKAGGQQMEYLKITMEEAMVSSYQVAATSGGDAVPVDQVSLNFSKLEIAYSPQKQDGSLAAAASQKYDFAANKKI
jgi:type VI secretion system secreted protein Hcp